MTTRNAHPGPAGSSESEHIARSVVALTTPAVAEDWEHHSHQHDKAQLLYTVSGMLSCYADDGVWIVPPQCAVWIPSGVPHSARGAGNTECYCLFIEATATPHMPAICSTIAVSALLRELLLRIVDFEASDELSGRQERLIATFIDELGAAPVEDLHLPMPQDARLAALGKMLLDAPADKATAGVWAARIGMSERNMSRALREQIGMSFGRWRRQLHVVLGLRRMALGVSVQAVADELGYDSAGGFVTMFRKAVGKPPARYLMDRNRSILSATDVYAPAHPLPTPMP